LIDTITISNIDNACSRVIAATNRDLDRLIELGEFRADLYYRLGVFPIRAPALRERHGDIPLLTWFFVSELQHRLGKKFDKISTQAMDALTAYDWPGNVRELKNIIERAMILTQGTVLELGDWFPGPVFSTALHLSTLNQAARLSKKLNEHTSKKCWRGATGRSVEGTARPNTWDSSELHCNRE